MVTISKAMSPTHSSSYFDKDDYYTEGYSQWAGAASIDLGVAGTVEKRDFYALANGFDPSTYTDEMWRQGRELDKIEQNLMSQFSKLESEESKNSFARSQEVEQYNLARQMYNEQGNKLVRDSINQNSGIQQHSRAGFDITTSAPKSVTIEAIVNNKEDVLNAHREATKETLAYIEKEFAQTRVWNQASGMQIIDHTHNLSIAQFEHSTSRAVAANTAPDPQLHTHNFVMNMTRSSDGAFRALEPSEIYKYQKLAGQIYQNQLANKMQELGYNLEWTKQKNGNYTFEIKGSEKIVGQFSKRSQSISSQVQAREQEIGRKMTQEEKQVFKNELRIAKEKQDLDQLRADWKNQINEKNLSMPLRENGSNSSNPNIDRLSDINKKAIERVEKFESVLDKHNIYLESLREGQGNYKLNDVIMDVTRNQGLEHINNKYMHTQEMRSIEAGVINKMLDSQGTMQPLANRLDAIRFIDQERTVTVDQMLAGAKGLKADQKSMINRILTSTDQYTIIQGDAGTGKTYAIEKVNEYINKARVNIEVIGLAPTGAAAQQLEEKAGIKAMTIDKFLVMHKADSPYVLQKKDVENIGISKQDLKFFSSSDSQTMYAMREFRDSTWNAIKASYERDAWRSNKGSLNDTRRYMRGGIKLTQALKTSWSTGWERRITQSGDTMYSRTTNKMNYWNKLVDGKRKTIRETIKFDKATGKSTRTLEVVEKNGDRFKVQKQGEKYEAIYKEGNSKEVVRVETSTKKMYVIDEASMISTKKMAELQEAIKNGRVVVIGDKKQLAAVEQGSMFRMSQDRLTVVELNEKTRQKTNDTKDFVRSIENPNNTASEIRQTLKERQEKGHLVEIGSTSKLNDKFVDDYAALAKKHGVSNVMGIATTNQERRDLNAAIRDRLIQEKTIDINKSLSMETLTAKRLSDLDKHQSSAYQVGDVLKSFNHQGNIKKDQELRIEAIDKQNKSMTVVTIDKKTGENIRMNISIERAAKFDAYSTNRDQFSVGDKIKFDKNIGNVKNGETAIIKEIDMKNKSMTVVTNDNKEKKIDIEKNKHLSHGYVTTVHSSQGADAKHVLDYKHTDSVRSDSKNSAYVSATRATQSIKTYTNSVDTLAKKIETQQQKMNVHDYRDLKSQSNEKMQASVNKLAEGSKSQSNEKMQASVNKLAEGSKSQSNEKMQASVNKLAERSR